MQNSPIRLPVHSTTNEVELKQTTAIFYYITYHCECLRLAINDTLSPSLRNLHSTMSLVNVDCLKIIFNYLNNMQVSTMSPEQILENVRSFMGDIAVPPSMSTTSQFMSNVYSNGILLEKFVEDWIFLRDKCAGCSDQVSHLMTEVIDCLRSVYTFNPEYKFTMELLQLAQENKIPLKTIDKYFFQGCVVAAQIQANCMSMGLLQLVSIVPSTSPCFLYKYLITEPEALYNNAAFANSFQRKMYDIYKIFQNDLQYGLCDLNAAVMNPPLVSSAVTRSFKALQSLLSVTPLYHKYESDIQAGVTMMNSSYPAAKENVKYCLAPTPSCMLDVFSTYEMISNERITFTGEPSDVMIARWGHSLYGLLKYMETNKQQYTDIYADTRSLCYQVLEKK